MNIVSLEKRAAFAALFIRLFYSFLYSFLLGLHSTTAQAADYPLPYFQFDSFSHSETVPIKSAIDDWQGQHFSRGQRQWSYNWLESGIRYKSFSLGYIKRADYDLRFSEDLAQLYWLTSNRKEFTPNESQDIYLHINSFKGQGIRVAFNNQLKSLRYALGFSYFHANEFYEGSIAGSANTTSAKDYDFDLALNYHYTEDRLFDRNIAKPEGEGYALDFSAALTFEQHQFAVKIQDIAAHILWYDAPYTRGTANSDRNTTDENGYLVIHPTLSGFEGISKTYKQKLSPRKHFVYNYQFNERWLAGFENRHQYNHALQALSLRWKGTMDISLSYWPEASLTELTWTKNIFSLKLAADRLALENAKTFWLSIGINNTQIP